MSLASVLGIFILFCCVCITDANILHGFSISISLSPSYLQLTLPINLSKMPIKNIHSPKTLATTFCPEIPGPSILPGATLKQEAQNLTFSWHAQGTENLPFTRLGFWVFSVTPTAYRSAFWLENWGACVQRQEVVRKETLYDVGEVARWWASFAFNFLYSPSHFPLGLTFILSLNGSD